MSDISRFRATFRESRNIIAVAGAGLSAASGIPTFRDSNGLWRTHDAASLATPSAFAANPSRVWQFYHIRRENVLNAYPNPGHYALAMLLHPTYLRVVAPSAKFSLVTQNVDGLSGKAMEEVQRKHSGVGIDQSQIYEMHGRVLDTECIACQHRETNISSPICPALGKWEEVHQLSPDDADKIVIPDLELPRCLHCGGLLRPGIVWFEEVPRHLPTINALVDEADLCLVIGTSSTVYPAASYAYDVASRGGKVAVFNTERTEGDGAAEFLFLGPCEDTLPKILLGLEVD